MIVDQPRRPFEGMATWIWDPGAWEQRGAPLLARARELGIRRLFVGLRIIDGAICDPHKLDRFVHEARAAGIFVDAVEGDPQMVDRHGLRIAVRRAQAIRAFQNNTSQDGRLGGVQFDIEPYVGPGWRGDARAFSRWGQAVAVLADAVDEAVDLVVPFWLLDGSADPAARNMLLRVARCVRVFTVMLYRSDTAELHRLTAIWAAWGGEMGIPMRFALELSHSQPAEISFRGDRIRLSLAAHSISRSEFRPSAGWAVHAALPEEVTLE
ncbi:hypothetical protein [Sphingomonas jeddahensis]|uniref:hypothetical protein n=1 Tax=Sphingomonas jeddahensis TaxID=1915074 RepID=UPI000977F44E|nr:hypothetical protein [Sphingomonas jeddahensis]